MTIQLPNRGHRERQTDRQRQRMSSKRERQTDRDRQRQTDRQRYSYFSFIKEFKNYSMTTLDP